MEDFAPQRPPPVEVCRREVDSCDVVVLLLAHRYGSRPPGQQRSYTELEYEWALARPDMALLAFVVDPAYAWPPPDIDTGQDALALREFVARVTSVHEVRRFGDLATFREDLILALRPYETSFDPTGTSELAAHAGRHLPEPPAFHAVPPYAGSAPFVGRQADIDILDEWGRSADPVMVIEGIGGTGKSALTWHWAQTRAPDVVAGLAGRLWWSFYDGSASITRFLRELLAYTDGSSPQDIGRLEQGELLAQVFSALRSRAYLVVLDGFERVLGAYRADQSTVSTSVRVADASVNRASRRRGGSRPSGGFTVEDFDQLAVTA